MEIGTEKVAGVAYISSPIRKGSLVKTLTGQAIRKEIANILSDKNQKRILLVAFVGADAADYLPQDKTGIQLYCWPKAGGTNPYAIDDLRKAGVKVNFVDKLHMKMYWSEKCGAVIGSANLTDNALGDAGLHEFAVKVPSTAIPLEKVLSSLAITKDFDKALGTLRAEHIKFYTRNRDLSASLKSKVKSPSFTEWLSSGKSRIEWRLGWYESDAFAPKDAQKELKQRTGHADYKELRGVRQASDLKELVFTLGCKVTKRKDGSLKVSDAHWWLPETCTTTSEKQWQPYRHIWFAQHKFNKKFPLPFKPDNEFCTALAKALEEVGGPDSFEKSGLKPTQSFLNRITAHL